MTSSLLSDAVVAVLVFAFPFWDRAEVRGLRAARSLDARTNYYWRIVAVEWPLAALTMGLAGGPIATFTWTLAERPKWLPPVDEVTGIAVGLGIALVAVTFAIVRAAKAKRLPAFFKTQLAAIGYLLPKTPHQRILFLLVSLTAGVCEEIVFRGFLTHYFAALLPAANPLVWLLASSVVFGIIHAGTGAADMFSTGYLGLIFGAIYMASGSLLAPIALHVITDARFALIPAEPATITASDS